VDASAADADAELDGATEHATEGGEGRTPLLALDGFNGPLEQLLALARARQVDLARVPLADLVDQLTAAWRHAPPATPLSQKGDWVVMAAWLLQLRSLLLLPAEAPTRQAAEVEAEQVRLRLLELRQARALAAWLERRPQLGRDVFARGQPEAPGAAVEAAPPLAGQLDALPAAPALDVIEFLWASLALFDDDARGADTTAQYRPRWLDLHTVPDARARILRRLAETPDGHRLDTLLPEAADAAGAEAQSLLRRRSAWTSTFVASLELAKRGDVALAQEAFLDPVHVRPASSELLAQDKNGDSRASTAAAAASRDDAAA